MCVFRYQAGIMLSAWYCTTAASDQPENVEINLSVNTYQK